MWWYLRKNASFPLSVLFRKSYLEYFYSFRAKETYLKTPDSLNQWSQTTDFISSPAVKTDTALELTDCKDVSSSHENLILVVFSICWPQFPRVHILRGPETRKGEAEEEPEEECPLTLCLRHVLTGATLGFRAPGKACSRPPQGKNMAKG